MESQQPWSQCVMDRPDSASRGEVILQLSSLLKGSGGLRTQGTDLNVPGPACLCPCLLITQGATDLLLPVAGDVALPISLPETPWNHVAPFLRSLRRSVYPCATSDNVSNTPFRTTRRFIIYLHCLSLRVPECAPQAQYLSSRETEGRRS